MDIALNRLNDIKVKLLLSNDAMGFIVQLLFQTDIIFDEKIDTACINPTTLKINPNFLLGLRKDSDPKKDEAVGLIIHELYHNGLLHTVRLGDRDPELWNIAADYVINGLIKEAGYIIPCSGLYDPDYLNKSTEEVYNILEKKNPSAKMPQNGIGKDIEQDASKIDNLVNSVIHAANVEGSKEAGKLANELKELLDKIRNPQLPWFVLTRKYLKRYFKKKRSFQRPSRRSIDPFILPNRIKHTELTDIVFAIDTSGSMSKKQLSDINSEIHFVHNTLKPNSSTIIEFDAGIQRIMKLGKNEPIQKMDIVGRGGTNCREVFEYVESKKPTVIFIFSDMWMDIPKYTGNTDVFWVVSNNPSYKKAPFGELCHLESKE